LIVVEDVTMPTMPTMPTVPTVPTTHSENDIYIFKFVRASAPSSGGSPSQSRSYIHTDDVLYKIGRSTRMLDRRREMAREFQDLYRVHVLSAFPDSGDLERDVHKCLDDFRTTVPTGKRQGRAREFYDFGGDDARAIERVQMAIVFVRRVVKRRSADDNTEDHWNFAKIRRTSQTSSDGIACSSAKNLTKSMDPSDGRVDS
jgi:hypothetical protein